MGTEYGAIRNACGVRFRVSDGGGFGLRQRHLALHHI